MNRALLTAALLASVAALAAVPNATAACIERPNPVAVDCNDGPDGVFDSDPCNVGPYALVQDQATGFVYAFACVGTEFDRVCVYYIVLDSPQDRQCVPVPNP
ncbi:MAG: hypothetical protein QOD77_1164 [Thermoplasmata archaeon]|jgi:hypothetical protein|nr:hypothetical protein [Thermoplasmata archaeon]